VTFLIERVLLVVDPCRTGRVQIDALVADPVFLQFARLRCPDDELQRNALSPRVARPMIDTFADFAGGVATREDILHLQDRRLSELFVDRVFEGLPRTMDFAAFVRFELVWRNMDRAWARAALFDVLDLDDNGVIDMTEFFAFFGALVRDCATAGEWELPAAEDAAAEMFDMVTAVDGAMTKEEFVRAPSVSSFVRNLVDLKALVYYYCGGLVPPRHA